MSHSETPSYHRRAVIGNASNFWPHSTRTAFGLTHPSSPTATEPSPRLRFNTTTTPTTLSPAKTTLVIIDMHNFFLSPSFGRAEGAGHAAMEKLLQFAIPVAQKAGIRIVWLNWGLTDEEVHNMPLAVKRAFGLEAIAEAIEEASNGATNEDPFVEKANGIGVDKHGGVRFHGGRALLENGKDGRIYKGLGSPYGPVTLPFRETLDTGRLLMRDTWNEALYPPLDSVFEEGPKLMDEPDVWIHKNRMSGMRGGSTMCEEFFDDHGIRSLLFASVNIDQCVSGTLRMPLTRTMVAFY